MHGRRQWLRAALTGWAGGTALRGPVAAAAQAPEPATAPAPAAAMANATAARAAPSAPPPAPMPSLAEDRIQAGRRLVFPRDHGSHPGARIEWWYATGWLQAPNAPERPLFGFQLTFFRSRTGLADALPGRFAPKQLLIAMPR